MRYQNWDVLLFPDQSRVPMQEFDLRCQVVNQSEDEVSAFPGHINSSKGQPGPGQLPTLTAFICSLGKGTPFRISVHCWQSPVASDILLSFKTAQEKVAYEVRIYIDGTLAALRHVGQCTVWPEVIETTASIASRGDQHQLRFPPFHPEVLSQKYWKPDDGLGRIRIVITEGVIDGTSQTHGGRNRSFDRLRDILAFSFQHAPLSVLEHAGIAWPNARMFNRDPIIEVAVSRKNVDTHAHSPQRPLPPSMRTRLHDAAHKGPNPGFDMSRASVHDSGTALSTGDGSASTASKTMQPEFRYSLSTDVTMHDACSAGRVSEMSGVCVQAPDFEQHLGQAAIDEIVRALSPNKKQALLEALSSPGIPSLLRDGVQGIASSTARSRSSSLQRLRPGLQARMAAARRDSGSGRGVSVGNASSESLDDNPTLGEVWSNSELSHFSAHATLAERVRSGSAASKRKRNVSPQSLDGDDGDVLLRNVKGMSTSPGKQSPTPIKPTSVATTEQAVTITT